MTVDELIKKEGSNFMGIRNEIDRIKANVSAAYSSVSEMGGTIPEEQNSANLAAAVMSIPQSGGVVQWENIYGRPDLSNVSSMKTAPIVLSSDEWNESSQQTAFIEGVLVDENSQLIIPVPKKESKNAYISSGIECIEQLENGLLFKCTTVPEEDIHINVFIFEAAEVGEEYPGEFVWWSPHITSDTSPAPYVASASSIHSMGYEAWRAFDGNLNSNYVGGWDTDIKNQWLMFDFGQKAVVKGIRIRPQSDNLRSFPISGIIEGSNDGINFVQIKSYSDLSVPQSHEFVEFMFGHYVIYQYYRLSKMKNTMYDYRGYSGISEMEFLKLEESS